MSVSQCALSLFSVNFTLRAFFLVFLLSTNMQSLSRSSADNAFLHLFILLFRTRITWTSTRVNVCKWVEILILKMAGAAVHFSSAVCLNFYIDLSPLLEVPLETRQSQQGHRTHQPQMKSNGFRPVKGNNGNRTTKTVWKLFAVWSMFSNL